MASRHFPRLSRRLLAGSGAATSVGAAGLVATGGGNPSSSPDSSHGTFNTAAEMFHNSSLYSPPTNWSKPLFKIRNDYPAPLDVAADRKVGRVPDLLDPSIPPPVSDPMLDAPWTLVDFTKDPRGYCAIVKEYCFEGNVNNNFNVHENKVSAPSLCVVSSTLRYSRIFAGAGLVPCVLDELRR